MGSHLQTEVGSVVLTTTGRLIDDVNGDESDPFPVKLAWSVTDPAAVVVTFAEVVWRIGRELLDLAAQGAYAGVPWGDVRIVPAPGSRSHFQLSSPGGFAVIAVDRIELARFVVATIAEIPLDALSPWPDFVPTGKGWDS